MACGLWPVASGAVGQWPVAAAQEAQRHRGQEAQRHSTEASAFADAVLGWPAHAFANALANGHEHSIRDHA